MRLHVGRRFRATVTKEAKGVQEEWCSSRFQLLRVSFDRNNKAQCDRLAILTIRNFWRPWSEVKIPKNPGIWLPLRNFWWPTDKKSSLCSGNYDNPLFDTRLWTIMHRQLMTGNQNACNFRALCPPFFELLCRAIQHLLYFLFDLTLIALTHTHIIHAHFCFEGGWLKEDQCQASSKCSETATCTPLALPTKWFAVSRAHTQVVHAGFGHITHIRRMQSLQQVSWPQDCLQQSELTWFFFAYHNWHGSIGFCPPFASSVNGTAWKTITVEKNFWCPRPKWPTSFHVLAQKRLIETKLTFIDVSYL